MRIILQNKGGEIVAEFPVRHDTVIHNLWKYVIHYKEESYVHKQIGNGVFIFSPAKHWYPTEVELTKENKL